MQIHFWGTGSEWFWAFGQFVVVAITLFFVARQLKIQTASHIVQSVCTIQERWHSEAMQRVRLEVCKHWKKENREFDGASEHIANFFEELGTFVKIGAIPKKTMWDVQSWNIENYWAMLKKGIETNRDECDECVYADFEKLFYDMRKIRAFP